MSTDAEQKAMAAYPELQRLIDIRNAGWIFQVASTEGTVSVKGLYIWNPAGISWADMIQIRDLTDAAAVRLNPNRQLVWQYEGDMVGAIDGLLQLPQPDDPFAPRLVIGKVGKLWVPSG
jgi:hypothetical protein